MGYTEMNDFSETPVLRFLYGSKHKTEDNLKWGKFNNEIIDFVSLNLSGK
jgi:hypothetical protein